MTMAARAARERGFTLIEVLVVIGILTLLVVAFAPSIFGALTRGEEVETRARIMSLQTWCEAYARVYGEYPPDDFSIVARDSQAEWNLGNDNGKNSGIESLAMHLSWDPRGGGELDQHEDWLANTDDDKAPVTIPMLDRRAKVEVVDAWGTPFAYFSARVGSGYQSAQIIVPPAFEGVPGQDVPARPWKNPNSDGYLSPRKFQIVSAGADFVFNTDDDLVWPERPIE